MWCETHVAMKIADKIKGKWISKHWNWCLWAQVDNSVGPACQFQAIDDELEHWRFGHSTTNACEFIWEAQIQAQHLLTHSDPKWQPSNAAPRLRLLSFAFSNFESEFMEDLHETSRGCAEPIASITGIRSMSLRWEPSSRAGTNNEFS